MAYYNSSIIKGNAKTYDYGLFRKSTYFSVPDNTQLQMNDDLVIFQCVHSYLSLDTIALKMGNAGTGNDNFAVTFGLYVDFNDNKNFVLNKSLGLVSAFGNVGANASATLGIWYNGKLELADITAATIEPQITAAAKGTAYQQLVYYANNIAADTEAPAAKTALDAFAITDVLKNLVLADTGVWETITPARVKELSDIQVAAAKTDLDGVATTGTLVVWQQGITAKYTDAIKNAKSAAITYRNNLPLLLEKTKSPMTKIYLGIKVTGVGTLHAGDTFRLDYSDTGGSDV
ncbi:MAG: hypothetical protein LBB63_00890 [Holosporaceae bacterium]|jgi:hypothetical protein|nr:hypothetical protein [Holosporaceae bacterium]